MKHRTTGFTLLELLVAMAVLALIATLVVQWMGGVQKVTDWGQRRMDADAQALALFDRMALDIAQMVRRPDIDCFLKDNANPQPGNDQIAFFSQVPGYYPATGSESPFSVVGYRVNGSLQRFGCGLMLNTTNPAAPMFHLPQKIADHWPKATNLEEDASHYEQVGPQVFRFEYYYVIKSRILSDGAVLPARLSAVPWDTRPGTGPAGVHGLRDVAAIGVAIAVVDPKTQTRVRAADLASLAADLPDFDGASHAEPGALAEAWQRKIQASGFSGVRVYHRWFFLP